MEKNRRKLIIALYFGLAIYLLPMYPHGGSANELTRWATAASLIEKGSFEISWTEPLIGPNVDTARFGDSTYSNKAPGPAIIAAPIYAITRFFIGPPTPSNIRVSWFAMRFVVSTLPLLLLAVWLFRRGTDEFGLAMLLFATPLFVYSLLFFSHVFVAVLVYGAFRLLFDKGECRPLRYVAAGAISGLAVISEFPAAFAVGVFAVGLLFTDKVGRFSRVSYFVIGGLPFVLFLLLYNNALFGSFFSMSYAHESFPEWAEVAGQGFFGIGLPSPANAYLLLISPSRGLLFSSPILVLPLIHFVRTFDRRNLRNMVRLAAIVVSFLIICGHGAAHGGWAFGPRYLIFVIPFLLDPFFEGEAIECPPALKVALITASILLCVIPALTFPFAPPEFTFPHNDFWMIFMRGEGWFVPNLANLVGVANGPWNLLPVLVVFAALLYALRSNSQSTLMFLLSSIAGMALVAVYLLSPGLADREEGAFRRATIAERYFKPTGRMDDYITRAVSRSDQAAIENVRRRQWAVADARAYAPNDFPYFATQPLAPSPTVAIKDAIQFQKQQKITEAEDLLRSGEDLFPFARCEFSTNLAVLYFTTNRKDAALSKLEAVQPFVSRASPADCVRSQFLLGSLYRERGRDNEAKSTFQLFLFNTADSKDAGILNFRKQLLSK